jgi:hypothetical protein
VNYFDLFGIWVAGFLSLMVLSVLYRENRFYRLAEHIFIGLSAGYGLVVALQIFLVQAVQPLFRENNPQPEYIVPIIIGALYYAQFSKKISFLYRLPISLSVGFGLGVAIPRALKAFFLQQVIATALPLYVPNDPLQTLNNWVIVFGTALSLLFFVFFRERKGAWGRLTAVGRYVILITLGAIFGSTVMGREAVLIQRMQFLLGDPSFPWVGLRMGTATEGQWAWVILPVFLAAFLLYLRWERKKPEMAESTMTPSAT